MKKKYLWILAGGHVSTDLNQGALPAILPFLVAAGGLKYAQAAGLTFAVAFSSSLLQPIFGIMADKMSKPWLLPIGVLLGGCGMALIGFFPNNYWFMFAVAIFSGLGIAAYHPEGARMANKLSGKKKGGSMSIFSVGGNVGFSVGPMLATSALLFFGLRGSAVVAIPAIIMFIIFIRTGPAMASQSKMQEEGEQVAEGVIKNEWGKFLWLSIAIISRSIIFHSFNTFLPLYWINVLHQSKATSGMALSFLFFWAVAATVIGGHLADRIGIGRILKIGWILLIPVFFLFTKITNPIAAWLMLIPLAFGFYLVNTPMIVLGQKYLPANIGFASGITMGLGVSIGGITAPLIGNYADTHGLTAAFTLLSILPFIGALVALTIKPPKRT